MAYKYKIDRDLFKEITSKKAYLLGLIWSDGSVNIQGVRITSKDISFLECLPSHFGMTAPVYVRKSSCAGDLCLNSKTFKEDLLTMGFHNRKSQYGKPQIADNHFSHFLRGVFDGDGCVHVVKTQLRIYIATNQDAGVYFKEKILQLTGVDMTLIKRKIAKNTYIKERKISDNNVCRILQTKNTEDARVIMEYIYKESDGLYLHRKLEIFEEWQKVYENNKTVECIGCKDIFARRSKTDCYCEKCRLIKRRCQNRRQDMSSRGSTGYLPLNEYRKPHEFFCNLER